MLIHGDTKQSQFYASCRPCAEVGGRGGLGGGNGSYFCFARPCWQAGSALASRSNSIFSYKALMAVSSILLQCSLIRTSNFRIEPFRCFARSCWQADAPQRTTPCVGTVPPMVLRNGSAPPRISAARVVFMNTEQLKE